MTEVKPVLWVNSDDLNNRNFVGINAVKEGHMDLGRYYTIPLVSFDDHERAVKALRAENERLRRESEGRLAALHDKAEETKQEWMRAERAEAELASALALLARMRAACGDDGRRMQGELEAYLRELRAGAERVAALEREAAAKQARIDALMLEYCPDEMTLEQVAEWTRHQRPLSEQEADAARQQENGDERG